MDFNVVALNRIVDAIDRVTYAIKMTKTYADAHIISLGHPSIVETVAVSGLLGILEEITELIGSVAETSTVAGVLSSIDDLISTITEAATVTGVLSSTENLIGDLSAISNLALATLEGVAVRFAGPITEESGAAAELDSQSGFVGDIQSGTTVLGWLSAP